MLPRDVVSGATLFNTLSSGRERTPVMPSRREVGVEKASPTRAEAQAARAGEELPNDRAYLPEEVRP